MPTTVSSHFTKSHILFLLRFNNGCEVKRVGDKSNASGADDRGTVGTSNTAYTLCDDSMLPLKCPIKVTSKGVQLTNMGWRQYWIRSKHFRAWTKDLRTESARRKLKRWNTHTHKEISMNELEVYIQGPDIMKQNLKKALYGCTNNRNTERHAFKASMQQWTSYTSGHWKRVSHAWDMTQGAF